MYHMHERTNTTEHHEGAVQLLTRDEHSVHCAQRLHPPIRRTLQQTCQYEQKPLSALFPSRSRNVSFTVSRTWNAYRTGRPWKASPRSARIGSTVAGPTTTHRSVMPHDFPCKIFNSSIAATKGEGGATMRR